MPEAKMVRTGQYKSDLKADLEGGGEGERQKSGRGFHALSSATSPIIQLGCRGTAASEDVHPDRRQRGREP